MVAVASKPAPDLTAITADDECGLTLDGFLVFADEPKAAARDSLAQLAALGIEVKVATGDNPRVAEKVCADLGLPSKGTITGAEMEHSTVPGSTTRRKTAPSSPGSRRSRRRG